MKIIYPGSIGILQDAAEAANALLANPAFYEKIKDKTSFDFSNATGAQVAASMQRCPLELTVKTYKRIFSRALGYELPEDPTSIFINIAGNKLNRSLGSIAATFIHEAVHAADSDDAGLDYGHHGNLAAGNEGTAPYWIGDLAEQMIDHPQQPVTAVMSHAPHAVEEMLAVQDAPDDVITEGKPPFTLTVKLYGQEYTPMNMQAFIIDLNTSQVIHTSPPSRKEFTWSPVLAHGPYEVELRGASNPNGHITADIEGVFAFPPPVTHKQSGVNSFPMFFEFFIK